MKGVERRKIKGHISTNFVEKFLINKETSERNLNTEEEKSYMRSISLLVLLMNMLEITVLNSVTE